MTLTWTGRDVVREKEMMDKMIKRKRDDNIAGSTVHSWQPSSSHNREARHITQHNAAQHSKQRAATECSAHPLLSGEASESLDHHVLQGEPVEVARSH
jgi:hypothetical protein